MQGKVHNLNINIPPNRNRTHTHCAYSDTVPTVPTYGLPISLGGMKYLIFSFHRSDVLSEAQREIEFRHSTYNTSKILRKVLTLGSQVLSAYPAMREKV